MKLLSAYLLLLSNTNTLLSQQFITQPSLCLDSKLRKFSIIVPTTNILMTEKLLSSSFKLDTSTYFKNHSLNNLL